MPINVGLVGATGLVGKVFLELLIERDFPIGDLRLFASANSEGLTLPFNDTRIPVQSLRPGCFKDLDVVFFSSGDDISKEWAPRAVEDGAFAIDNSAAFRMDVNVPLVVPEVNGSLCPKKGDSPSIIANPNCSTIQLVMVLEPLRRQFGLEAVRVATYQAVSGAGKGGHEELLKQTLHYANNPDLIIEDNETSTALTPEVFPHPIGFNSLPHIGSFNEQGYCSEEVKIMRETRKILGMKDLKVSAFTVRIPAWNAHSEAVWITLGQTANQDQVLSALKAMEGLEVIAQTEPNKYPHALMASETNPVYVGRVHQDLDDPKTWLCWVVADNLRKGAALNGIQIAERIFDFS